MEREARYHTQSFICSIFAQLKNGLQESVGARSAVCTVAALAVLLHLPVRSACAQGYMFGRASFSVGSTGAGPASVAAGDFNGDGIVDLAVVQPSRNSVAILLGKADGTFSPAVFYPTGAQPVAVAVGDFNGDGRQDLAIANQNCASSFTCRANGSVSILLGKGDGTFQSQTVIASGTQPSSIAMGDFNADGKPDLVISNGTLNSIVVVLGNGDGTFQAPVAYSTPGGATSVALGDFNRDGKIDLAVGDSSGAVSIFLGKGDGTFQHATDLLMLAGVNALIVGDFNHDGAADLAVTYAQENAVSILLGNGDGTFQPRVDYLTGTYPTGLAAGDFNGDGRLDVVVTNGGDQTFSILLGNGDGTLQAAQNFVLPAEPTAVAVQDFNRDGKADLAIVLSEIGAVSIIVGRGDGTFPAPQSYGGSLGSWAIAAGNFNGDGKLDLVTTNLNDNSISLFSGAGDGTFAIGAASPSGPVPVAAVVGDFNRDGKLDLAVVNQTCTSLPCTSGSVSVFLGNGDGTFQPRLDYSTGNIPVAVTVADLNGDGIPDLAVVNNGFGSSDSVSVFLGKGDGTFLSGGTLVTGTGPTQAVAADFDGNGTMDLAVAYSAGISIIPGRGAGTFGPRTDYPITNGAKAIAVGDFNNDGKPDLAVTTPDSVVVLLGKGDGTFQPGVSCPVDSITNLDSILVGDFNGDGKLDLLVGKSNNAVSILVGNGDGTFLPAVDIPVGKSERGWVAGDFDGDGGLDLAAASVGPNAVFVALNAPVVALYPAKLDFGGQGVGTTSAPATVTISNPSGAPLAISGATASDAFSVANDCPATLAPGSSCALSVFFSPTASGDASGVLTISDNASGNSQKVPVHGIGIGEPAACVSPTTLSFAPQNVGTTSAGATVTLLNSGGAALSVSVTASGDFAETDNCVPSLAAGAQCTISVTFAPTAAGTRTGVLTIADNALSSPQTVSLSGTGVAKPVAGPSTSSLAFGNQRVNTTSSPQSLTLNNSGNAPLQISSIDATGDFSVTNNCPASLGVGTSCTISVSFAPTATGIMVGAVNITDNGVDSPQSVALTGTGAAPMASLSASNLTFVGQMVGTFSSAQSVSLSNPGNAVLTIVGATLTGPNSADFSMQNGCGGSLNPGQSCGMSVIFSPAAAGTRNAVVTITTDAAGSPQVVAVTGTGTAPVASVSPSSVSFASQMVGSASSNQSLTLSNPGNATLTISGVTVSGPNAGDFSLQNQCGGSLTAGTSCGMIVSFAPAAAGTRTATLNIATNAS
ncbi:MAG: FG-GAP-like repeat-containing protein, partial [Terriglobia bacterium]